MLPSCSFLYTNKQGGTTDQHCYEHLLLKVLANYPRSNVVASTFLLGTTYQLLKQQDLN